MQFTDEHLLFRKTVRSFLENEVVPHIDEWEEAGQFPAHELLPKLAQIGALGLEYDPKYGGQGADHSYTVIFAEELGHCLCAGVAMGISVQSDMATPSLATFGSEYLKETYLKPALTGEAVVSIAVTEPDAGSDVASIRTTAVQDGDSWVINGTKLYITNGYQADWICLVTRTSDPIPGQPYSGMAQIIVPTNTPGFSVSRKLRKMGNLSSDTAELVFDDVRVPLNHVIGEDGQGFQQQMLQFQRERLMATYMTVSGMRVALKRTIQYLKDRHAFGKPLITNQYLAYELAELTAEVDLLREYSYACADAVMRGEDVTRQATIAKLKAGRLVRRVADTCIQYHGGIGYMEETWTSRYYRDARLLSIGAGADEVMLRILTQIYGIHA